MQTVCEKKPGRPKSKLAASEGFVLRPKREIQPPLDPAGNFCFPDPSAHIAVSRILLRILLIPPQLQLSLVVGGYIDILNLSISNRILSIFHRIIMIN